MNSQQITADEATMNKINDRMMNHHFKPVRRLYIDINALKDTKLGLMIYLYKDDPEGLRYLEDNIDTYNKRLTRNFKDTLPGVKYSELELVKKYNDSSLSEFIFDYSPDTDLSLNLAKYVTTLQQSNSQKDYHDKIFITINFYPLTDNKIINLYVNILNNILPKEHFQIKPIFTPHVDISDAMWCTFDILMVDDLKMLIETPSFRSVLIERIEEQIFQDKKMFAPYQAEQEAIDKWIDDGVDLTDTKSIRDCFSLTETYFKICCDFQYVPYLIPITSEVPNG